MRVKEEWKQPVSRVDAWKAIFLIVLPLVWILLFLVWILALGQIIFQTRFERLGWAVSLLALWITMAQQTVKPVWRKISQILWLVAYTFFAGGHLLPHGPVASWLVGIGALLMVSNGILTIFDFNKSRKPVSTDTADATE